MPSSIGTATLALALLTSVGVARSPAQDVEFANAPGEAHPAAIGWAELWELADRDVDAAADRVEVVDMAAEPRLTSLPEPERVAVIRAIQKGWITQWIEVRHWFAVRAEAFDGIESAAMPASGRTLAAYTPVLRVRENGRDFYDLVDPATGRILARMTTGDGGTWHLVVSMDMLRKSMTDVDLIPIIDFGRYFARQGEVLADISGDIKAGRFASIVEADEALWDRQTALEYEMTGQIDPFAEEFDEDELAPAP